ncbi:MAG: type I-B CRISPR-associated protein Cas7/Cst2/DevR, partial [Cetobacterium sp.]
NETRFHNNLYLASSYAKANDIKLKEEIKKSGLRPYQYEYDNSMKQYSITFDLDKVGVDVNYDTEASKEEKILRVKAILDAIENLA